MAEPVELYFVERWTNYYQFPSKVGGYPVWLRLNNLPNRRVLLCKTCGKPLIFLLQVYSKIEIESAYHRTLFLFICTNGNCYGRSDSQNFVVLRSQLPQKNDFYSDSADEGDEVVLSAKKYRSTVCSVSGCITSLKFSEVYYCCENHRDYEWRQNHPSVCRRNKKNGNQKGTTSLLLPEFDLVMEHEELPPTKSEKSDAEKMQEYSLFMMSRKAPKKMEDPLLDNLMERKDKMFNKFQKRIKIEPEQVLRYQRGGTPLWVSSEHVPSTEDIPDCVCGAKRIFEFQVMPQLLNYLSLDSLGDSVDWGTLAVYTCSKSCAYGEKGYVKEFVWKQDFSDSYQ